MQVLFLGNIGSPIIEIVKSLGDEIIVTSQPLDLDFLKEKGPGFIVSFGYPHLVPPEVIDNMKGSIINLHISYLPWNKGSDPDFWSLVDGTPKGVTIHYMDATFDTGDIIVQEKMSIDENDTLASYYVKLHSTLVSLFKKHWPLIRVGDCPRIPQAAGGTYHRSVDKNQLMHLLKDGTDTLVGDIVDYKG